jgi:putative transposase
VLVRFAYLAVAHAFAALLDRTLIRNETHLRHALHEYERHYNLHRTHRALAAAAPLRELPHPLEADRIERQPLS